jgi:hypothetical protein
MTKFSGTLPGGEANGLSALAAQLLRNPQGTHIVVGIIDTKTITTDVDTGDQVPTVRFRRVEPVPGPDADHVVRIMQRATERRTGAAMLPIEMEDELQELLKSLDLTVNADGTVTAGDSEEDDTDDGTPDPTAGHTSGARPQPVDETPGAWETETPTDGTPPLKPGDDFPGQE